MTSGGASEPASTTRVASLFETSALVIALMVFAMVLMLIGFAADLSGTEQLMIAVALLTGIVCVLPILTGRMLQPNDRHLLISLVALAFFIYFAVPVLTQYFGEPPPSDDMMKLQNIAPGDILNGQVVVLVGLIAMLAGYAHPLGRLAVTIVPKPTYEWSHPAAMMVAFVMLPLGWTIVIGGNFGLLPKALGTGFLGSLASATFFGVGLLTLIVLRYRSQPAKMLILLMVPPAMFFAFLTGSKRFVLAPLMMMGLAYLTVERKIRVQWIVVGFVAIVTLYPLAQFWREFVLAGNTLTAASVIADPGRAISAISAFMAKADLGEYVVAGLQATSHRLDGLAVTTVIVRDTPLKVPYQGGWSIGYVFIGMIPRILWPGKPTISFGQWITDTYGPGPEVTSSTGSSWVGEFYMNFGIAGVIGGMIVMGVYFRFLHELLFRSPTIPAMLASMVVMWNICTTLEMNLITPVNQTIFTLVPVVIAHVVVRTVLPGQQVRRRLGTDPPT